MTYGTGPLPDVLQIAQAVGGLAGALIAFIVSPNRGRALATDIGAGFLIGQLCGIVVALGAST